MNKTNFIDIIPQKNQVFENEILKEDFQGVDDIQGVEKIHRLILKKFPPFIIIIII